ncbi:MAG: hypothetical protein PHT21_03205 [Lachnospiraceae bacterium]|nr:hypothetical protein [Lachnospiraceae bacterium]
MKILYLSIIFVMLLLSIFSRKIKLPQGIKRNKYNLLLIRISLYLYKQYQSVQKNVIYSRPSHKDLKKHILEEYLIALNPLTDKQQQRQLLMEYHVNRIKTILLIVLIGTLTGLAIECGRQPILLKEMSAIEKYDFGEGDRQVHLNAKINGTDEIEEVILTIPERVYSINEIESLYEEFLVELRQEMLGDNKKSEQIRENLNMVETIKGYPFKVSWSFDQYEYISDKGVLSDQIPEQGSELIVFAEIEYDEWKKEELFQCILFPGKKQEVSLNQMIEEQLKNIIEKTKEDEYLRLPEQIEGIQITWSEKSSGDTFLVLAGIIITIIIINLALEYELKEKISKREEQMMLDYPELVSKICLFLGAGLTVRSVFQKLGNEYLKKRADGMPIKYAYEEIAVTCFELEGGVSEMTGYDNFARRCRQNQYLKLGSILSQNLKKGSARLQEILEAEARAAFENRKSLAKKRGEEAGTKLLLPMMLMMAVIMIIIMVPAFLTFNL